MRMGSPVRMSAPPTPLGPPPCSPYGRSAVTQRGASGGTAGASGQHKSVTAGASRRRGKEYTSTETNTARSSGEYRDRRGEYAGHSNAVESSAGVSAGAYRGQHYSGDALLPTARQASPFRPNRGATLPARHTAAPLRTEVLPVTLSSRGLDSSLASLVDAPRIPPAATSTPLAAPTSTTAVTSGRDAAAVGGRGGAHGQSDRGRDREGGALPPAGKEAGRGGTRESEHEHDRRHGREHVSEPTSEALPSRAQEQADPTGRGWADASAVARVDTSGLSEEIDRALAAAEDVRRRSDRLNASLQSRLAHEEGEQRRGEQDDELREEELGEEEEEEF